MKGIIADSLGGSLLHPSVECRTQSLAFVLDREIDERRCAAERGGAGAGLKIVRAGRSAEGHVKVGMDIDATGQNILPCRVDDAGGVLPRKIFADSADL